MQDSGRQSFRIRKSLTDCPRKWDQSKSIATTPTSRPVSNSPIRRPAGTKPTGRAARDTVTGSNGHTAHHPQIQIPHNQSPRPGGTAEHETGITSRAQAETEITPTVTAIANTPLRRPIGTNPSHRAARDTVTGPNGQTAHHLQNPIPQNQYPRPAGTPEIETGITSREKLQTGIKSLIKSAHKAHKYEESRKPLFHKNLRLYSKNSGRQDSNLRLLGPKERKYLFISRLILSANLKKKP